MVAVAVVSLALTALIKAGSSHTHTLSALQYRTFAHWVALNRIAEFEIARTPQANHTQDGQETLGKHDWNWETFTETTPDSDVYRVNVQVTSKDYPSQPVYRLSSYVSVYQNKPDQ